MKKFHRFVSLTCGYPYISNSNQEFFTLTLYGILSKKIEVADIFLVAVKKPCVKWPPSGRSRPMILPWGSTTPVYTAKFAGDPVLKNYFLVKPT